MKNERNNVIEQTTCKYQNTKTLFIGPSGIGKTSFLKKIFHHRNNVNILDIPNTIGVDVKPVTLHQDDRKIRLNVWDCAGNQKYKGLGKEYYLGADIAIIFKIIIYILPIYVEIF